MVKKGRASGLSFFVSAQAFYLALLAACAVTLVVYLPGLHGPFLFDDFANLPSLGNEGAVRDFASLARYLTSGIADPTGRPLALLSFLIDAQDWPAAAFPFKRTNLLLHVANGVLLATLLRRFDRLKQTGDSITLARQVAPALAAGIWLLHPLFVSTTLYVVQREAMLATTTTLLGLHAWLRARDAFFKERSGRGMAWMLVAVMLTVAGVLAKANGVLLPILILVIEYIYLADRKAHRQGVYRTSLLLFGWLPALILSGYLIQQGIYFATHAMDVRPWTIGERLLTEPRVLWMYQRELWLPSPYTAGVFNDQVAFSRSLIDPWTTGLAILGICAVTLYAYRSRIRHPRLCAAIAFYLVGIALESTTIPLELYYEHRNYLPSLLLFWPVACWMLNVDESPRWKATAVVARFKPWLAVAVPCVLAIMTFANTSLWGDEVHQADVWARINPRSLRAQTNAAQSEMARNEPALAVARLRPLVAEHPEEVQLSFNLLAAQCAIGSVDEDTLERASRALATTRDPGSLITTWFERAVPTAFSGSCRGFAPSNIEELVQAGISNSRFKAARRQDLIHVLGEVALRKGDARLALLHFNEALDLEMRPAVALSQAAFLGSSGYPREGLEHLTYFRAHADNVPPVGAGMPRIHAWLLSRQNYWSHELDRLTKTLQIDAEAASQSREGVTTP